MRPETIRARARRRQDGQRFIFAPGFTIVELLVVISIIVLLISILMPVLKGARASARNVQCLSSLRQAGIAIVAYTASQNDVLPVAIERAESDSLIVSPATNGNGWSWAGLLHLDSGVPVETFQCPEDKTPPRLLEDLWANSRNASYAATLFFWGNTSAARPPWSMPDFNPPRFTDDPKTLRLADIKQPSRVQNVWDGARVAYSASTLVGAKSAWPTHITNNSTHKDMWRHYGGVLDDYTDYGPNALFVDGHVVSNIDMEALEDADVSILQ